MKTLPARSWLVVASENHVARAVGGSFVQACHGKAQPLARMRAGDGVVCYSPRTEMRRDAPPLRSFTALGRLVDDRIYDFDLGGGWVPHRRDVAWEAVSPVPLAALQSQLHLTARAGWAMALRRGHLALDAHDFALVAAAMRALSDGRGATPRSAAAPRSPCDSHRAHRAARRRRA